MTICEKFLKIMSTPGVFVPTDDKNYYEKLTIIKRMVLIQKLIVNEQNRKHI